jgi:uncharacterized membrane protein YfcA
LALGYVSTIGLIIFAPASMLMAPFGVRIAHALPKCALDVSFGIFPVLVSARFVFKYFMK